MNALHNFFKPQGVAVVGASSSPSKLSYGIVANLLKYGYSGQIVPINPKSDQILGLPCYPSVSAAPDPIDLAVIVLPAALIPDVIEECGQRGIHSVIIISGGFKEIGPEGKILEQRCLRLAQEYDIRLIGPNCVGTVDLYSGLNTTFINGLPRKGNIAFVSQSGAVCGGAVDYLMDKGLGFSHFISLGNEADLTETDMIEYLSEDGNVKVIAVYAESIRDGAHFIEVCKKVTRTKPIILIKSGKSEAGARAVSSHTGSLAGSQSAYQAAFQQSGVIVADTLEDLYAIASGFESQPLPKGARTAIVTNAGGPAALASDALEAMGLTLALFSESTKTQIRRHVNPAAQVDNPVDMLGGATPDEYAIALEAVLQDPEVDAAIAILVPTALVPSAKVAAVIGETAKKFQKPVIACMMGKASLVEAYQVLESYHVPVYPFPETCAVVLGQMWKYKSYLNQNQSVPTSLENLNYEFVREIISGRTTDVMGEMDTRALLQAYGIPVIRAAFAASMEELEPAFSIVSYPAVMKIVSPDILHKSDSGGIVLNIRNLSEGKAAYQQMLNRIHAGKPDVRIEGVLIETMASRGIEVIVGMKRDPNFGPLMMVGLGGIYVELFKDIAFRVAPITRSETIDMIMDTAAGKLLAGVRGNPSSDTNALIDTILQTSQLALDHPEIEEIEINPLLVMPEGNGVCALDARAIFREKQS